MTPSATPKARMVVGITGASGIVLAIRLLETLRRLDIESHLVMSRAAKMTLRYETDRKAADIHALADVVHAIRDIGAPISSGSFRTLGMIVVPCSMKTLAEVATGVTGTLLSRAADVTLKERRRLVLIPRETPLHAMHLRNMLTVTEMGGVIAPPVPAFYNRPESLDDVVDHLVARALDLFGLDAQLMQRWGEDE
ncbi:3-octaprenyl-4-hydroxybenzoate carboxy-lyase [Salinisphaera orenii YIM 95161]|uniref:Flavin prenyltransferase UbiX n=2 Tax=Salinisphaera TaxID=180541 RepID=A0A423PW48_9GAMM|nr:3-octaprenyl-4-hydroxybenzoate carboxy-lyase [Salinisphaera halophila YIM 95161]